MADDLPKGSMILIDAYQPGLKDGSYTLTVEQQVSAGTLAKLTQKFTVAGPRFSIDPADVHAQFPPAGHIGAFTEVLPHIVFNKRLLPWERFVEDFGNATPWVALLVFEQDELLGSGPDDRSETMTVSALLKPADGARTPQIMDDTLSDDERAMSCRTITMSGTTFAKLLPTALELPLLAHVRRVDTSDKILLDLKDEGLFSVVFGNRFPAPASPPYGAKTIIHLVSLEGFGDLLTGAAPATPPQATVRMVSLMSWTFSCLPDPAQTFSGLATNLAYANGALRPADSLRMRPPAGASTGAGAARLNEGYCALGYHAVTGEEGFAWYRGPIAPVVNAAPVQGPFATAAAAMIYDQTFSLFDHSLSAAWRTGQGLALSNRSFATNLVGLRNRAASLLGVGRSFSGGAIRQAVSRALPTAAKALHAASKNASPLVQAPQTARPSKPPPIALLKARLTADPACLATLDDDPDMQAASTWLGNLQLLKGVPFLQLVPDSRMLPPESIRFGFIDPGWISALLDGALSLGVATSLDVAVQAQFTGKLKTLAAASAQSDRSSAQGQSAPPVAAGPLSAMLCRSALVTGWPGVAVAATASGTPMALLRLDCIGPDVLLAIFNGVPDTVTLTKPHEGMEFGVDDNGQVTARTVANGKIVSVAEVKIYDPQHDASQTCALRPGGDRVLNLRLPGAAAQPVDLVGLLAGALKVDPATIGPALFGLQMIKGSEQIVFSLTPPPMPPHEGPAQ